MTGSRITLRSGHGPGTPVPVDQLQPGVVVNTPTSLEDDVFVTLDGLSSEQPVGPCLGWRNVASANWPAAGDQALVLRVSQGRDWIVAWE